MFDRLEKSASAGGDIQKFEIGNPSTLQKIAKRHQGLTPHRIGCPVEQDIDLEIIEIGRLVAEPAIGLVVKILQIVAGTAIAPFLCPKNLLAIFAHTSKVDLSEIREKPGALAKGLAYSWVDHLLGIA